MLCFKMGFSSFATLSPLKPKDIKNSSSEHSSFLKWFSGFTDAITSYQVRFKKYSTKRVVNNNLCLVVWGINLTSTIGTGRFTKQVSGMIKLAPYQMSVIIGLLLARRAGWLTIASKTTINARLGFKQSLFQANYVWFVFNLLSHYCSSYPHLTKGNRLGKPNYGLQFFTRGLSCFTELHSLFYPQGTKIIPEALRAYDLLTPVALAHWIMGDGGLKSKGIFLCTDSYSIQDVIRLSNVLIIRYDLKCTLHKSSNGRGYRIYISRNSVWKVVEIVKPYLIPSMYYKVGIL